MASIIRTLSGHAKDYFDSYRKAPKGGTNKGDANSNEMLKPAPFGSSGMSAPSHGAVDAMQPKGGLTKSSLGAGNGTRNMGGNGKGKFPNMIKDMK